MKSLPHVSETITMSRMEESFARAQRQFEAWVREQLRIARDLVCPQCNANRPIPALWEMPGPEVAAAAERGDVYLG
jgi:hypothetical protein